MPEFIEEQEIDNITVDNSMENLVIREKTKIIYKISCRSYDEMSRWRNDFLSYNLIIEFLLSQTLTIESKQEECHFMYL